jgi:hypothetical protein
MSLKSLKAWTIPLLGADPELFVTREGRVVGSKELLPQEPSEIRVPAVDPPISGNYFAPGILMATATRDGVQVEFQHRCPAECRQYFGYSIRTALYWLAQQAAEKGLKLSFDPVIDLSDQTWEEMKPEERRLGCNPSLNIYGPAEIGVDPDTYRVRSAGGHIHLGFSWPRSRIAHKPLERLVALLDVFVGNTAVLLDRNPRAAERRQVYGRAGEYRLPSHGLEYRTLSNFFLRGYPLASLMTMMARRAVQVHQGNIIAENVYEGTPERISDDFAPDLLNLFKPADVQNAINNNDFALAWANFEKLHQWWKGFSNAQEGTGEVYKASTWDDMDNILRLAGRVDSEFPIEADEVIARWRDANDYVWGWERWSQELARRDAKSTVALMKVA